ncbi:WD40 repeat domain-containing protein [Belliella kenyensis]|uniref:WD40 repeat domain-containing protein n=1 Tax=Belliella kenyensis TaxID=1472724 RepID=A0ABV8EI51_9BACT|nr:WD40 repeat domain-containing protein [Belliella kenyensis]MCH7401092.1 WD40 repeat domain-containing protein [Belliella kenyensis]MDN3604089.1 WD40 repeat domain-containing protein [Belliella kenyensis]
MSKINVNKLHTLTGHNDCIYALTEGAEPQYFYTGAGDGMVVAWNLEDPKNGKLIAKLPHSVYALAVDHERNLLLIGHNFEGIHVIDLVHNQELWSIRMTDQSIFDIKITSGIAYVATGDGLITMIDLDQKAIKKRLKLSDKSARVMAVNPILNQLAIGFSDHTVKILNLTNDEPIANLEGHTNSVFALAYAPDQSKLISGGRDAHLKIWNAKDFLLQDEVIAHMYAINFLAFRNDGKYFATCSMDKSIKVWSSEDHKLLKVIDKARHAGHGTSINKIIWSKYDQSIISVSDDRNISIWQLEF